MNLLEKLKPEFLQKLEIVKEQYPITGKKIEIFLENNRSVFLLSIMEASEICMFFDIEMNLNNLINLFKE